MNSVRLQTLHRAPPQQPTMLVVKPEGGPAASVKPGQKSCVRSSGIITLSGRQPSDGSGRSPPQTRPRWDHQFSGTALTGESRFHISTLLGIQPVSLMMGSKQVDHWTIGTVYEGSEIAGSPQHSFTTRMHDS
jgi:hypothetical protein